jgi:hypothetical protein
MSFLRTLFAICRQRKLQNEKQVLFGANKFENGNSNTTESPFTNFAMRCLL